MQQTWQLFVFTPRYLGAAQVKCLKGVGVLSPDDGPDTAKDILSQFRSGAVHTMVVSTVVAVPLGDASLRSAVTALTSLPAKGASVTILDASVPPSGRDPLPNQSQKPLSICSPAVRGESQASPKLDRSGPIIEALLAQVRAKRIALLRKKNDVPHFAAWFP